MKEHWGDEYLSDRQRDIIASDTEGKSITFQEFFRHVNEEAQALFEDPSYYANQPHTFKCSYYER